MREDYLDVSCRAGHVKPLEAGHSSPSAPGTGTFSMGRGLVTVPVHHGVAQPRARWPVLLDR